jgi:hypothetical protein
VEAFKESGPLPEHRGTRRRGMAAGPRP